MNVLYPEITKSGIVDLEYQKEPDDIIWCVLGDGRLIGLTYDREQNIYGWHQHPVAGRDAKVEAVQIIPSPNGDLDDVWLVVSRTIEGDFPYELALEAGGNLLTEGSDQLVIETDVTRTQRFIEYIGQSLEEGEDIQGAGYLDASLEFNAVVFADLFLGDGYQTAGSTDVSATVTSSLEIASEADEFIIAENGDFISINDPVFLPGDVGREIVYRYYDETNELWRSARAEITTVIDQESALVTIVAAFPDDDVPFNEWRLTATTLRGLWHLEGETVSALADGQEVKNLVVTDGAVTMPFPTSRATVGYPYTSTLATQRIEAGSALGTAQAKVKRIHKCGLRLYASLGGKVGPGPTNLDFIQYRTTTDLMDEVPPLLTGDTDVFAFPGGYETDGRIWVVSDQPLPMTVIALYPEMETQG
jgi:hypothetical protein